MIHDAQASDPRHQHLTPRLAILSANTRQKTAGRGPSWSLFRLRDAPTAPVFLMEEPHRVHRLRHVAGHSRHHLSRLGHRVPPSFQGVSQRAHLEALKIDAFRIVGTRPERRIGCRTPAEPAGGCVTDELRRDTAVDGEVSW